MKTHFIPRALEAELRLLVQQFPVVALTGPRQSGKTAVVKHLFPERTYVSLEDLDNRSFALEDPRGFLATYPKTIIDEAQRAPDLFSYLQTKVDETNEPGQFILTGSQNFLLLENISQSLAGRVALLKLLPLSLTELQSANYSLTSLEELLHRGFYPSLYKGRDINPSTWLSNYIQTYVERDVRLIKNITDLSVFQLFLKMCANRVGQLLNASELANDCGVSHNTILSWIGLLEVSFIAYRLKPYYQNFNKRLIKMPKLYFYDTGIVCSLLDIRAPEQLKTHPMRGPLFENYVISELLKNKANANESESIFFWRDKNGNEIDCLLEEPSGIKLVEIKSGQTIARDFFKGFRYWETIPHHSNLKNYLVYGGNDSQSRQIATVLSWSCPNKILEA